MRSLAGVALTAACARRIFRELGARVGLRQRASPPVRPSAPATSRPHCAAPAALLPLQVERVLKGYNSTVLAYGQTGSGKTHTMGSADGDNTTGAEPVAPADLPAEGVATEGQAAEKEASAAVGGTQLTDASGLIARAVHALFRRFEGEGGKGDMEGGSCSAKASFIEIYKEEVHDLLQRLPDGSAAL